MSLPTFPFSTTAEEVVEAFAGGRYKAKMAILITGTSINGIGFEAARALAKHANLVIMTGYNADRLKLTEDAIKSEVPSANIRRLVIDLSSLAAARTAAAEVNACPEPLHVRSYHSSTNIDSSLHCPFELTVDGLEKQMATDHIGPFLFTKLLAPKLLAAATPSYAPRVVFVSSARHASGTGVNFRTIGHPEPETYHAFETYFQCKSANALTAIELSKRSRGRIKAYSLHPGAISTNIYHNKAALPHMQAFGILDADGKPTDQFQWKTIPQGAATILVAAFDTRLDDKPGAYLVDCVETNKDLAPHSSDPANAERLWAVTEEIIGEKFTF
ncbi:hypothetical protein FB451DRAFT_1556963 [Mycena latifolia]|nr:hypothetical protein FB451DRAFT_1556963 [Mycena latifolia]